MCSSDLGSLWIGEENFERVFPDIGGYRMFLVKPKDAVARDPKMGSDSNSESIERMRDALEEGWSDEGLSCAAADGVLSKLLAVQNTYLSAFQVLGGLGLLLGTLGLGVTQLRSALERRSELAAMRAMGFPKGRLVWGLFLENGWQLIRGLGIGMLCALAASAPKLFYGGLGGGLIRESWLAPLLSPLGMLAWVLGIGFIFCIGAAVLAMRQPLLESLRSDR